MSTRGQPGTVVLVGSLNTDLTVRTERFPEPGETVTGSELITAPGGKSSNQAVAAAILGSRVRLVGAVGEDTSGTLVLEAAQAAGVDVAGVRRLSDHATGSAMIVVNGEGENTIIVSPGANGVMEPAMIPAESLADAAVLCLCLEIGDQTVLAAARLGHDAGAQVLLNFVALSRGARRVAVPDRRPAGQPVRGRSAVERRLVSRKLAGGGTQVRRSRPRPGHRHAGCRRLGGPRRDHRAPRPGEHRRGIRVDVVDTTGCGDAFTGAVAHRLAAGDSLVDAARFAGRVSAMAATGAGAQSSYTRSRHWRTSHTLGSSARSRARCH